MIEVGDEAKAAPRKGADDRLRLAVVADGAARLVDRAQMGELFKVVALTGPDLPAEVGAEPVSKGRRTEVNGRAKRGETKKTKGRESKGRRESKPDATPSRPTKTFGDHTPAFMLREVKLAASA